MTVETSSVGAVLVLRGEIDAATVSEFRRRTDEISTGPAGPDVRVIDFTEATFVNSMAISLIVWATAAARHAGHRPIMRGYSRNVRQVFDMVGLSEMFQW